MTKEYNLAELDEIKEDKLMQIALEAKVGKEEIEKLSKQNVIFKFDPKSNRWYIDFEVAKK